MSEIKTRLETGGKPLFDDDKKLKDEMQVIAEQVYEFCQRHPGYIGFLVMGRVGEVKGGRDGLCSYGGGDKMKTSYAIAKKYEVIHITGVRSLVSY